MSVIDLHPAADETAPRLVVEFQNSEPIDLIEFSTALQALAREHQAQLRDSRPGIDIDETRLLILDIRRGSIILELAAVLAPIISTAEVTNTVVTFVEHVRRIAGGLALPGGRVEGATTQQLRNMGDTFQAVASQRQGGFRLGARLQSGDIVQEFFLDAKDAARVTENAKAQRREIEDRNSDTLRKVLMRLHQSSVADPTVGKRTAEKGVIERIDTTPRTLIYVSELAGQRIKDEILRADGNPFKRGFVVDVEVETIGGKPRAYRILDVDQVIDLEEE